jgi:hypothetical protein
MPHSAGKIFLECAGRAERRRRFRRTCDIRLSVRIRQSSHGYKPERWESDWRPWPFASIRVGRWLRGRRSAHFAVARPFPPFAFLSACPATLAVVGIKKTVLSRLPSFFATEAQRHREKILKLKSTGQSPEPQKTSLTTGNTGQACV